MANGRMSLSVEGEEKLIRIMAELELNDKRPEALRLAFVKGLVSFDSPPERKERKTRFVIPDGVVARGDDYILFKHLLVERVGQALDAKSVDDYMLRYIEEGLDIMAKEVDSLSDLDNYLLYLIGKHS
ncbi:hypothetical protein KZ483_25140 [Paenibacillus sp. sptzw28]|uniref:hypothetical protein n=1 Tax=Paenibacillus sp. sptzw28 TaxID=715179 RepID=UPI001C6E5C9C|nr:hypothetical protein [Paenibacillus sp. sptzw28]QYR20986.1 hypothetical protein KZ483_25140 [Paenibacillus sp. sptzw28]